MAPKRTVSVELSERQIEWLETMVKKYDLPDLSKGVRCLVNFVNDNPDKEEDIFEEIRCLDC